MSVTDEFVSSNQVYAGTFDKGALPMPPGKQVAVLACMDARLNVYGGQPMLVGKLVEEVRRIAAGPVENVRVALDPIFGKLEELVTPDDLLAPVEQR